MFYLVVRELFRRYPINIITQFVDGFFFISTQSYQSWRLKVWTDCFLLELVMAVFKFVENVAHLTQMILGVCIHVSSTITGA